MYNLEQLKEAWKVDVKISELDLSRESLKVPSLHSKYLDLLVDAKRKLSRKRHDLARMHQFKQKYWAGLLTKEELKEYDLPQYQYSKPLKGEVDAKLAGDDDCIAIQEEIEEIELQVFFLESVMKSVHSRSFDIKNSIEFSKFQAGG